MRKIFAFVLCFFIFANICSANENFVKNYVAFPSDISVEFNNKSFSRVLAIGDIHGQFTRFNSMYEKVGVNDKDLVIFLGDYIKGYKVGEDLKTVLWLMEKAKQDNFIFL
ncbi:MAG: metallophosphoesterase, partial [Synergistaceae bacterium]|nr:metallophosphoesterase [Synergistaceae bacterium]